jgi:hypothetical protein
MNSSLDTQIRQQLASYLSGSQSLEEFEDWLALNTADVRFANNEAAEDLTYSLELLFAEFTSGHRDEQDLKQTFSEVLEKYPVSKVPMPV